MATRALEILLDDVTLSGTLWTPDGAPPRVLVIMSPGSGPSDRDNDVFFPPIRERLLENGFAVASFDKRGVEESTGDWMTADIATQAGDLRAQLAAARRVLDPIPAGLFGHSQGGWVALEASVGADVDFVITSSGPGVSPRVQEEYSTATRLEELGWSAERRAEAVAVFSELMGRVSAGLPFAEAAEWMKAPDRAGLLADLADAGCFIPDGREIWAFATSLIDYEPPLDRLEAPILAIFGGADTVVPVAASVDRFLTSVPSELLRVAVLPGGDHRLQRDDGDLVPGYIASILDFVEAQLGGLPALNG